MNLKKQMAFENEMEVRRMVPLLRRICDATGHPDYEAAVDALFEDMERLQRSETENLNMVVSLEQDISRAFDLLHDLWTQRQDHPVQLAAALDILKARI